MLHVGAVVSGALLLSVVVSVISAVTGLRRRSAVKEQQVTDLSLM